MGGELAGERRVLVRERTALMEGQTGLGLDIDLELDLDSRQQWEVEAQEDSRSRSASIGGVELRFTSCETGKQRRLQFGFAATGEEHFQRRGLCPLAPAGCGGVSSACWPLLRIDADLK